MPSLLVADCPRCGAGQITFDVANDVLVDGGARRYEAFCVCRACTASTVFVLRASPLVTIGRRPSHNTNGFMLVGPVSLADVATPSPPQHVPGNIKRAFHEAAKCSRIGCFNASGSMFRLCLDLATKNLGYESGFLADRLDALCDDKHLPEELRELGVIVRQDGNDGAHDGTLDGETVRDLEDFTTRFLTLLFTEPARAKAAKKRRKERRSGSRAAPPLAT